MKWSLRKWLQPRGREELDEQVRRARGALAHVVVDNDRKATELRNVMAGALRLREEYDQ